MDRYSKAFSIKKQFQSPNCQTCQGQSRTLKKIVFLELFLRIIEEEKWNLFEKIGQLRTPNLPHLPLSHKDLYRPLTHSNESLSSFWPPSNTAYMSARKTVSRSPDTPTVRHHRRGWPWGCVGCSRPAAAARPTRTCPAAAQWSCPLSLHLATKRRFTKISQSRRRPLLGPYPG